MSIAALLECKVYINCFICKSRRSKVISMEFCDERRIIVGCAYCGDERGMLRAEAKESGATLWTYDSPEWQDGDVWAVPLDGRKGIFTRL